MTTLPHGIIIPNRPDPANAHRLNLAALPMSASMESNGMRVDKSFIATLHKRITGEMDELQERVNKLTGYSINIGSGDQLADLLYNKLGLKQAGKQKWTGKKKRLAADSDVLRGMISRHKAIKPILDWKEREKLRSTYTFSLMAQADENDRIHPSLNHTGPETNRYSCSAPNLQNIPIRTNLGREIRKAFIPSKGNYIGTCDASQIEARTMAADALCWPMIEIFKKKLDLYWTVAERIFQRVFTPEERKHGIEKVTGISYENYYRFAAKTTALGVIYAIEPPGLVDLFLTSDPPSIPFLTEGKTDWDFDRDYDPALRRCTGLISGFFEPYKEILRRRKEHHRRARVHGFVWDMWGWIRWIPQVRSTHQWVVSEGLRAAGNLAGQGGAAGIMKLWMAVIWDRVEGYWGKHGIKMLMAVHDELISEGPKLVLEDFLEECKYILQNLIPADLFPVPLAAKSDIGMSWGDLKA